MEYIIESDSDELKDGCISKAPFTTNRILKVVDVFRIESNCYLFKTKAHFVPEPSSKLEIDVMKCEKIKVTTKASNNIA